MAIIRTLVKARKEQNLTQADLAFKTGINQGDYQPSGTRQSQSIFEHVEKLADGLNMTLHIEFSPKARASEHLSGFQSTAILHPIRTLSQQK